MTCSIVCVWLYVCKASPLYDSEYCWVLVHCSVNRNLLRYSQEIIIRGVLELRGQTLQQLFSCIVCSFRWSFIFPTPTSWKTPSCLSTCGATSRASSASNSSRRSAKSSRSPKTTASRRSVSPSRPRSIWTTTERKCVARRLCPTSTKLFRRAPSSPATCQRKTRALRTSSSCSRHAATSRSWGCCDPASPYRRMCRSTWVATPRWRRRRARWSSSTRTTARGRRATTWTTCPTGAPALACRSCSARKRRRRAPVRPSRTRLVATTQSPCRSRSRRLRATTQRTPARVRPWRAPTRLRREESGGTSGARRRSTTRRSTTPMWACGAEGAEIRAPSRATRSVRRATSSVPATHRAPVREEVHTSADARPRTESLPWPPLTSCTAPRSVPVRAPRRDESRGRFWRRLLRQEAVRGCSADSRLSLRAA